ncbi:MAG: efflux RND transporter permease subunit, partial [Candidatus Cloacimonas sp.]|nr:efflux RND transporter permease subunit [Candidatus Cloacimonadota bacterium]
DIDKPRVSSMDLSVMPVINLVLTGNVSPIELYDYADMRLKDRFAQIEGVALVEMSGGQKREIQVHLNQRTIEQNGISLAQLTGVLGAHNLDMPGGQFNRDGQEYSVRLQGRVDDLEVLRNLEIPTKNGLKKLQEIAEVRDTGSEVRERTTYFNNKSKELQENLVSFGLVPSPEANPVEIAKKVHQELPAIKRTLPENMDINVVSDRSNFIASTINDTLGNIILGILLTGLILFIFLNDLRSTFIVALAMPTSIISTFVLMRPFGLTFNIMTLMGLSTSTGVLVTNSVVVLENIFRHKNMGQPRKLAADVGTSEIAVAVIASTLTNIVVFLPIATMTSMAGQMFREFALVVTFATLFSLLISFTMTPLLASLILPEKQKPNRFSAKFDKQFRKLELAYQRLLSKVIKNKKTAFAYLLIAVVLFVGSLYLAGKVGFEFMPLVDEGNLTLEVELPEGYDLSETTKMVKQIEEIIYQRPEVEHILTRIGSKGRMSTGTNVARASIKLIDVKERELTTSQVADLYLEDLAKIPNTSIKLRVQSGFMGGGGGGGAPVSFYVLGQEQDVVEELTKEIMDKIVAVPGITSVDTSMRPGRPELSYKPKYDRMAAAGVTVQDLAVALRSSVEGLVATQYLDQDREYDVKVMLDKADVDTPAKIANIPVVTSKGIFKFSQLADLNFTTSSTSLMRKDKYAAVEVTGGMIAGYALGDLRDGIQKVIDEEVFMPTGYHIEWSGETQMMQETTIDMAKTFLLAILLTYMLLAAILESFVQPLFILATLPLALIGVFAALFITQQTMNIVSMMAIIMLVGIVVNNAILLLDYINQLIRGGKRVRESILEACPVKLKPVIMSTLAIVIGMLPMALGVGSSGREFRQAMGIVSIGGLLMSAILTLFIIPSVFYIFIRSKKRDEA